MGHPPASPFCLTLNLAAGMRRGGGEREGGREGGIEGCQTNRNSREKSWEMAPGVKVKLKWGISQKMNLFQHFT